MEPCSWTLDLCNRILAVCAGLITSLWIPAVAWGGNCLWCPVCALGSIDITLPQFCASPNGKAGEHAAIQPFAFNKAVSDDTASRGLCACCNFSLSLPAIRTRGIMEMRLCIVIDWGALSFFTQSSLQFSSGFINASTDELSLWGKKHLTKLFSSAVN